MYELGFITEERGQPGPRRRPSSWRPTRPTPRCRSPTWWPIVRKQLIDMFGEDKVFSGRAPGGDHHQPRLPEAGHGGHLLPPQREGDPVGRAREHRDQDRLHPGHGGRQRLRQLQVQPGLAGPAPARLRLQDLRALRLPSRWASTPGPPTTSRSRSPSCIRAPPKPWKVNDLRRQATTALSSVVQATLRSDNTVYAQMALDVGAEQDRGRRPSHGHHLGARRRIRPSPWAVSSTASRRWRWLRRTPLWPTVASTSSPRSSSGSPTPTAT